MKINIKGETITLKYTSRSLIIYEKITGESFRPNGLTEIIAFFYSVIIGSNKDLALTFDEFLEWLDENPTTLAQYTEWLTDVISQNNYIANKSADAKEESEEVKKNS